MNSINEDEGGGEEMIVQSGEQTKFAFVLILTKHFCLVFNEFSVHMEIIEQLISRPLL